MSYRQVDPYEILSVSMSLSPSFTIKISVVCTLGIRDNFSSSLDETVVDETFLVQVAVLILI